MGPDWVSMPTSFKPPDPLGNRGWKIKIRDRERVEPPHVTILFKTTAWRWGLRERQFLDADPDPSAVPLALVQHLGTLLPQLVAAWDKLYPHNKVSSRGKK